MMHRILVIRVAPDTKEKFRVIADSSDPKVSKDNPITIEEAGGSKWAVYPDELPDFSSYSIISLPCQMRINEVGFWHVPPTGKHLDFDFTENGISELKTILSGEFQIDYEGRSYSAVPGDSILFLVDPNDKEGGKTRPCLVRFKGDTECILVYAEYPFPPA